MSNISNQNNEMQKLTQEIAVDLSAPIPQSKFGILDIKADSINTLPHFTEEATILAMKNLDISENDLILTSSRTDDPVKVSDESGMRIQIINEFEKKRLEMIQKIIIERNRIMMDENIKIPIANEIDEIHNEINNQNDTQANDKSHVLRKKKKIKQDVNPVNKKRKTKKKSLIPVNTNDANTNTENLSHRSTKRRKRKSTRSSPHKFQSQRGKELNKMKSSNPSCQSKNSIKPSTNRRPSVAERRQKYNPDPEVNQNTDNLQMHEKRNFKEYEANRKNDLLLISMRVKANEERRRMEREEKQQLIKKQAQLRMERLKGEETQFEQLMRDKKSKADEEMKRKEKLYMKIQERKMKALEQEKKKRQQQIYNNKIKQEEDNAAEIRFSKLRQKIIDAQKNNINKNTNQNNNIMPVKDNSELDLFSVTQPKNPKFLNSQKNNLSNSTANKAPISINSLDNGNGGTSNSVKQGVDPEENANDNNLPKQNNKNNTTTNLKPLLASSLKPKPAKNIQPQQHLKARSSLQAKNSAYYRQLLKLPVVGKNKTKIPYLRK